MTKKLIRNYIQNLKNIRDAKQGKVPNQTMTKINNVINLYEDRKISQFTTAVNLINGMTLGNAKAKEKGIKQYEKAVAKYEDKAPITERMKATVKKARKGKEVKEVVRKTDKQPVFKRKAIGGLSTKAKDIFKGRKNYDVKYMLFSMNNRSGAKKASFILDGVAYYPLILLTRGNASVVGSANVKANEFIETLVKRRIRQYHDTEKFLFRKLMITMNSSSEFKEATGHLIEYADAIRIESVEIVETDTGGYDEREEPLQQGNSISTYYRYIQTEVNAEAETMKEALNKQNYRENECWINALLENFEGTNLTREKRQQKNTKTLTRDKVLELLNMTEDEFINTGATINQMDKVFKFFNIPVRLYNFTGALIYEYNPENYGKGRVKIFRGLVKNNHIYLLNHDLETLRQVQPKDKYNAFTTSKFYITDTTEPIEYKMFDNVDELLSMTDKEEYALIHSDNDLVKVFHQLNEAGYKPHINSQAGRITNILCKFYYKRLKKYIKYNIVSQCLSQERVDEDVITDNEEVYNKITTTMFNLQKELFKENHLSYYNEVDIQILKECKTIVPVGKFCKDVAVKKIKEIDINKAFTHAGGSIKYIPKFTQFDIFRPFDEDCSTDQFNNLTFYIVEVYEGNIFFNKKYCLVYGKFLKKLLKHNVKLKILWYKQPSNIYKVEYKKLIDELYATKITDDEDFNKQTQKKLWNISVGMLEKSHNTSQRSSAFTSLKEACYYQSIYGGKVYTISECQTELNEVDEDEFETKETEGTKYYVLSVSEKKTLINGFMYIKELLLQYHNFKMYEAYKTLSDNNIKVYSVKTDCLTIHEDNVDKVYGYSFCRVWREGLLKFGTDIGTWRLEEKKTITLPTQLYTYKFNEVPEIPKISNIKVEVEDEWRTKAICEKIAKRNPCLIRARYAGSGKSYIGEYFQKLGYNVLFVVPTNRLLQEKEVEATTYNKFFSIAVHEDVGEKLPQFDYSNYDIIVFDEIYMSSLYVLDKVRSFIKSNTEKIVVATGDVKQLQGVEVLTNCQDPATYIDNCLDIIFKYNIFLTVCKRVGAKDSEEGERNREIIDNMYKDFWEKNLPFEEIIPKYFETTDDIMASEHNIAYTNIRCRNVANEIRDRLKKQDKYEVGEILIARKWIKQPRVNVNLRYRITNILQDELGTQITLQNIANADDEFMLFEPVVDANFIYSYCATCHSSQGASVKGSITIHEHDLPIASREWLWCAITRCVDFNQVKFYKNGDYEKQMTKNMIMRYFKNKVENYKLQDRRSQRKISEEEYITPEWCLKMFKSTCEKCNTAFNFETKQGKLCSNFTCQRLDSSIAHHIDNSTAFCFLL